VLPLPRSHKSALSNDPKHRGRQLRNSLPFEFQRELHGAPGEALVTDILERIAASEMRKKALRPDDALLRKRTVNVLLANLAVAALNRRNPRKFVALSLNGNDYANTGLSFATVQLAYEALQEFGLAVGAKGVAKHDPVLGRRGMRSRLRGNAAMRELMRLHGLEPEYVRNPPRDLIELKGAGLSPAPEPPAVTASRAVLERVNALLDEADLRLPTEAWQRIAASKKPDEDLTDEERRHRQYLGDMTAKRLFRVFTRNWHLGGRLYGGWWMGAPKEERRHMQIDGEPTIELDYGQLHPTMLFAKVGRQLDYDPYKFDDFSRELGKETFMRLLNRTSDRGGRYIRRAGEVPMPRGIETDEYVRRYKKHLSPVKHLLGEGMGLRLQREDSDLALTVLDTLAKDKIVALPVHDSFIVKARHKHILTITMYNAFNRLYGYEAIVK
jgi:hypothetical protein